MKLQVAKTNLIAANRVVSGIILEIDEKGQDDALFNDLFHADLALVTKFNAYQQVLMDVCESV